MLRHPEMDRPGVVCVHGYGMGTPAIDLAVFEAARVHRQLGLNVMCAVLPFHGARAVGSAGPGELITSGVTQMMHCHAQATWDVRRLLGWLRARGAGRIALHGVSLGANVAGLVAAPDPDLAGVIAGVPATDFTHSYRSAASIEPGTEMPWRDDPIWDELTTALRVISPGALPAAVPSERIAIYAGEVDGVVPAQSVRALWQHWGHPELAWYAGGHLGFFLEQKPGELVDRRLRELIDRR
jgi:dienelactone hydrolase